MEPGFQRRNHRQVRKRRQQLAHRTHVNRIVRRGHSRQSFHLRQQRFVDPADAAQRTREHRFEPDGTHAGDGFQTACRRVCQSTQAPTCRSGMIPDVLIPLPGLIAHQQRAMALLSANPVNRPPRNLRFGLHVEQAELEAG